MTGRCAWCETTAPPLTAVGFIEQGTSAGVLIHACNGCRDARRLVPLKEHPDGTDGQPRTYPPGRRHSVQ